jgi:HEAT repeat protein
MRHLLAVAVLGLTVLAGGCRKAQPTTAGGKPVSHWVEALKGPDARARKKAAHKLGNVGATDPLAIPALIGALKDRDARVRAEAALALLRIGPAAREAVPALLQTQKDPDARVRDCAAKALDKVQDGTPGSR